MYNVNFNWYRCQFLQRCFVNWCCMLFGERKEKIFPARLVISDRMMRCYCGAYLSRPCYLGAGSSHHNHQHIILKLLLLYLDTSYNFVNTTHQDFDQNKIIWLPDQIWCTMTWMFAPYIELTQLAYHMLWLLALKGVFENFLVVRNYQASTL